MGNGGVFLILQYPLLMFFSMFCVYIIFSRKLNRYYTGTTDDFVKRLSDHNESKYPGSFTSRGIPWEIYLLIADLHSEQAYQIEAHSWHFTNHSLIF
jgi:putative endonuclease